MIFEFDYDNFAVKLYEACETAFLALRADFKEKYYCYGIYTEPLHSYFVYTASSEEGLTRAAHRYKQMDSWKDKTIEQLRMGLRYSPCDSPLHALDEYCSPAFDEVCNIASQRNSDLWKYTKHLPDTVGDSIFFEQGERMERLCYDVLNELDKNGIFGNRQNWYVLNLWMGDQSDGELYPGACATNPMDVCEQFISEYEQYIKAS